MPQKNVVMAFRKRMKSFGYSDIAIKSLNDGLYQIEAVEPLAGSAVRIKYSITQMGVAFRRIKGSVATVYQDTIRRETDQQVIQRETDQQVTQRETDQQVT